MANSTFSADELDQTRHTRVFEQELLPLLDAVYSFASRLTNDSNRADDLVQETFLKAWRFVGSYTPGTNAKAWLFRICKHSYINEYRAKARMPHQVDLEDVRIIHNDDEVVVPRYFGLQEEMGAQNMGDEMLKALEALSEDFRTVVLLDLEDFTYEEIATLIGRPIGTVRSRLHRARNIMADHLREYAGKYGYNVPDRDVPTADNQNAATTTDAYTSGDVAVPAAALAA